MFFLTPYPGRPPHNHNPISPRLPRGNLHLVRVSQTTQPPSQSCLHPTNSAGKRRGGLRQSIQRSGRTTPVLAAVPTSDPQWRQLPLQLRTLFRLCSGAWTFSPLLFPLSSLFSCFYFYALGPFFFSAIACCRAAAVLWAATWRASDHIAEVKCCVRGFLKVSWMTSEKYSSLYAHFIPSY